MAVVWSRGGTLLTLLSPLKSILDISPTPTSIVFTASSHLTSAYTPAAMRPRRIGARFTSRRIYIINVIDDVDESLHPSRDRKVSTYPELDEEIDFLSAIISEQRTVSRLPASPFQDISKSMQLSESGPAHGASHTEQPTKAVFTTTVASPTPTITTTATTTTTTTTNHTPALLDDHIILPYPSNDSVFIIMSSVFIVAGSLALIIAGACWVRLQKGVHLTQKVDYPVYGLMKAQTFDSLPGDKKLAHSAQMYHYQHQKQQMLSLEKHRAEPKVPDSGASTDEENEDGDFTVYECPGLAPTGEMEVKNPLFDDSTLYFQRFHK
ncbi:Neural proliferation differentiation and control protein 1 [Collichthys lucidus]|uniref:Neural proliferation differentiation and control protein 1 n=1 Tax=Collichthys lucidus TaxID=240159 RepID=A0A4U5TX25_COLLU|nr:Neural proliferation differentiation and control protein 1 [Collichthys lucidus]